MVSTKSQKKYYGLAKEGCLLRIEEERNEDRYYCNETTVTFTEDNLCKEFLVDTQEKAIYALVMDTPWYNSTDECPCHRVDMSRYEVVEVIKILEVSTVENIVLPRALPPVESCFDTDNLETLRTFGHSRYLCFAINKAKVLKESIKPGDLFFREFSSVPLSVYAVLDYPLNSNGDNSELFIVAFKR